MFASGVKTVVPSSSIYVSSGDVVANSFDKTDFTYDSQWNELDLSAIVPAGVKLVHIEVVHRHSVPANWMKFKKLGYANDFNLVQFNTRVNGVDDWYDVWIEVDTDRKLGYKAGASPTKFDVVIKGWIK